MGNRLLNLWWFPPVLQGIGSGRTATLGWEAPTFRWGSGVTTGTLVDVPVPVRGCVEGPSEKTPGTPPPYDGRVPEAKRQAAELPAELVDDEDEDEDDEDEDDEEPFDDFDDDAGLLLDEEPRLSLR